VKGEECFGGGGDSGGGRGGKGRGRFGKSFCYVFILICYLTK
jgi:hypothetical protein